MGKGKGAKGNWIVKLQSSNKLLVFLFINNKKLKYLVNSLKFIKFVDCTV